MSEAPALPRHRLSVAILAALLAAGPGEGGAQQASEQQASQGRQFRARVARVLVDVTVVDEQGRFVPGLRREQFRVYEEGRPVPISFFAVERFRQELPAELATGLPAALAAAPVLPRYLVLFIDGYNTPPNDWARVRQALVAHLRRGLQGNDRVLLATLTPERRLLVAPEFVRDPAALTRLLLQFRANPEIEGRARANEQRIFEVLFEDVQTGLAAPPGTAGTADQEVNRLRHGASLAQAFAGERKQEVLLTLDALTSLAAHLDARFEIPGPKVMVLVSSGIPQRPGSNYFYMVSQRLDQVLMSIRREGGTDGFDPIAFRSPAAETIEQYLLRAVGRLNRLNYLVYTIAAAGPGDALEVGIDRQVRSNIGPSLRQIVRRDAQQGLRTLAAGTGGLAFDNSYNFEAALERVDADTAFRYVLGYEPPLHDPDDVRAEKFYRIRVEVDLPGVTVRARRGYVDAPVP